MDYIYIILLKKFLQAYFYPGHIADHSLEDIIGKIAYQFTACPFW